MIDQNLMLNSLHLTAKEVTSRGPQQSLSQLVYYGTTSTLPLAICLSRPVFEHLSRCASKVFWVLFRPSMPSKHARQSIPGK